MLYNPLNKYHPFIFFISYIYIYTLFLGINPFLTKRSYSLISYLYPSINKNTQTNLNKYWLLLNFSLYLGSWWAFQEGSWGGWWNWDSSEVFGLLILTVYVYYIHQNPLVNNYWYMQYLLINNITLIIFTYSILQLSYTLVSHNFGLNILSYGYVSITFSLLYILSLLLYTSIYYFKSKLYNLLYSLNFKYLNSIHYFKYFISIKYIYVYLLFITTFVIYSMSFNPILNNLFYNYFNLEVCNSIASSVNLKLTTLLFIYIILYLNISFYFILLTYFMLNYIYIWVLPTITFNKNFRFMVIHLMVLLILFIPVILNTSTFVMWNYLTNKLITPNLVLSYGNHKHLFTVDNIYLVYSKPNINYTFSYDFYNLIFWLNSIPNIQSFTTNSTNNTLTQSVTYNNYLYNFRVSIYDLSINLIDFTYQLLNIILLLYIYFRYIKIIL